MTTEAAEPEVQADPAVGAAAWHGLTAEAACERLGVDPRNGLDEAEVERRRAQFGPNKLAEGEKEPGWRAFLRQYRDLMQLVLLGAAVVSIAALQEVSTGLVIVGITVPTSRLITLRTAASVGRSSGFFASIASTSCATSSGTEGTRSRKGGIGSSACAIKTSSTDGRS